MFVESRRRDVIRLENLRLDFGFRYGGQTPPTQPSAQRDVNVSYKTLRMEVNSSKDLIVVQSASGKIPFGS
jgi:hypothetical protein